MISIKRTRIFRFGALSLCLFFLVISLALNIGLFGQSDSAHAGSNSVTWTTKGDFENNANTTNDSTDRTSVRIPAELGTDNGGAILDSPNKGIKFSGGNGFSICVRNDGLVWVTGVNDSGQLGLGDTANRTYWKKTSLTNVISVAAGAWHSLALKSDGTVWVTGYNLDGALGLNDNNDRTSWTQTSLTGVIAIAAGQQHSLALKSDGTVWVTGRNGYGQLGLGDNTNRNIWTKVNSLSQITDIATGGEHSFAIKIDQTLLVTGWNTSGQLGFGDTTDRNVWTQSLSQVASVDGGYQHSLAVMTDGSLRGAGYNFYGQLGLGDSSPRVSWTNVTSVDHVKAVAGGFYYSLLTKSDGTMMVTGRNDCGQLGLGDTTNRLSWTSAGLTGINSVGAGAQHSMALKSDNSFYAAGQNDYGQLGLDDTTNRTSWTKTTFASPFMAADGGENHSLALTSEGNVWVTGANSLGQLGLGDHTTRTTWVKTPTSLNNITAIEAGWSHSLALKSDHTVWATGNNGYGQTGSGSASGWIEAWSQSKETYTTYLTNVIAIAAGHNHSLALKDDGSVWVCGRGTEGQLGLGTDTSDKRYWTRTSLEGIVAIAAGGNFSLALDKEGGIYVTGDNTYGQLGLGNNTSVNTWTLGEVEGVSLIGAGSYHSLANIEGVLHVAGYNSNGQLGLGDYSDRNSWTSTEQTAIADLDGGRDHSLVRKTDNHVWVAGGGNFGQLGLGDSNGRTSWTETSLSGCSSIGAGYLHSLAIISNAVWETGYNSTYQLGLGDTTNRNTWASVSTVQQPVSYPTYGMIGGSGSPSVGLRVDAGVGIKAKWSSINFNGILNPIGSNGIKFAVRTSDDKVNWSTLKGRDGNAINWSTNYYGQVYGGATYTTLTNVAASRYLEIVVRLESDGSNTPVLNDVTANYDVMDAPPEGGLFQYKGFSSDQIPAGGWTNVTSVRLGATVTGLSDSITVRAEYEIKPTTSSFDGTGIVYGSYVAPNGFCTVDISGLSVDTSYKWRVRQADSHGRVSPWIEYNGGATAFSIEQTSPTGSISIESDATYTNTISVILGLSAADTGGSGVYQMRFSNDNTNWSSWEAYAASKSWNLTSGDSTKTVYVQYKDNAGNVSTTYSDSIILDTTAPSMSTLTSSTHPVESTWYSNNDPSFSWSASDSSGITGYSYTLDPYPSTPADTVPEGTATSTSYTNVANGTWYFHIRAKDGAGNWGSTTHRVVKIDTAVPNNPTLSSTSHTVNVWSNDNTIDINWSGAADAHSGVDGYSCEWSTSPTTIPDTAKDYEENISSCSSSPLSDSDSWYFHLRTIDNAGNWSGPVHLGLFKIDVTNPVVDIDNPLDGAVVSQAVKIETKDEKDNVGVVRVEFCIDGGAPIIDNAAPYNYTWDVSGLVDGSNHTVTVRAYDAAGNASAPHTHTVLINNSLPAVVSTVPLDGALNVVVETDIEAVFSEDMDQLTIDNTTFLLEDSSNNPITGFISYDAVTKTATFNPSSSLQYGQTYKAKLTTSIKDLGGSGLASDVEWNFTTTIPVADPGGPYTIKEGETLILDGSASYDPEGDPLSYDWDFGDGLTHETGVNPEYLPTEYPYTEVDGTYRTYAVTLTVNDGNTNSVPVTAQVLVCVRGDINLDGKVDVDDLVGVAHAFDSQSGDSNWNQAADVNEDGQINIFDLVLVARDFGKARADI